MAKKDFKAEIVHEKEVQKFFNSGLTDIQRFAMAGTANEVAKLGIEKGNDQFRKSFTLSNNFLVGTGFGKGVLKYNRAIPSHNINKIESSFGVQAKRGRTDLDFMEDQETGFHHEGMVPTKNAYPGGNKSKVIKRNLRRQGIAIRGTRGFPRGKAKTNQQRTLWAIRQIYLERFAMPGSKQFVYIRPEDEFFGFREGMYQFAGTSPATGMQFPHLKMIYAKDDSQNKQRRATHWMRQTANSFEQSEIDAIFDKEMNKSFTQAIKRHRF